jgi:glycosyltransferase involved in cell wall biosynthesis
MVNAEYPAEVSNNLANDLRAQIKKLNLEDRITLETRFLPDDESLALLQGSDLVVFAYMPTSESASGAARYGLASGTPTMVTDIAIFQEFGDAVWRVNSTDPQTLADAIKDAIEKIRTDASEHKLKQEAAKAWKQQHNFVWLSERLEGMLEGLHRDKKQYRG